MSWLAARTEAHLLPADTKEFAQAMDRLFKFARTFGIRDFDSAQVTPYYRDALVGVPAEALNAAVDTVIATWKWQGLPKPADLKALAEPTWGKLREASARVWCAQWTLANRGAA